MAKKHDEVTRENAPYMANGSMRTLRAIYNYARKTNKLLPSDNPTDAVDWNKEERRNTGMGSADLRRWFMQLTALDNPVRREFHLLTLLRFSADCASGDHANISIFGAARCTCPNRRAARRKRSIFRCRAR